MGGGVDGPVDRQKGLADAKKHHATERHRGPLPQKAGPSGAGFVRKRGLEPPRPCGHMDLNHARLPFRHFREKDKAE